MTDKEIREMLPAAHLELTLLRHENILPRDCTFQVYFKEDHLCALFQGWMKADYVERAKEALASVADGRCEVQVFMRVRTVTLAA